MRRGYTAEGDRPAKWSVGHHFVWAQIQKSSSTFFPQPVDNRSNKKFMVRGFSMESFFVL